MVPGAEAAGIVMRIKDKPYRRLAPIYFFRIPLPAGFCNHGYTAILRGDGELSRSTFLVDPLHRYCYVLYYPEKEMRNEGVELFFE